MKLADFRCSWGLAVIAAVAVLPRMADADDYDTRRVVSAGGSITEIIYALGLDDRLVGVDSTSIHPASALADYPDVGYLRRLAPEGILALEPSIILAEEDAGPPTTMDVLEASGVPVVRIATAHSEAGTIEKIKTVAKVFGAAAAGEALAERVRRDFAAAGQVVDANQDERPRVLFVLSMQGDRLLAAGDNSSAAAMIEMAGGTNAVAGFDGYKLVNHEAVLEADPEVVVVMRSGQHQLTADELFANPALRDSSAARNGRFVVMEGLYLLGFGPRTGEAVRDLAVAIAPAGASR